MANVKGTVTVDYKGDTLTLEMNFGVLGDLEAEFGDDFTSMVTGKKDPSVAFVLRVVSMSLREGEPDIDENKAKFITRKITSLSLFSELLAAAFPDADFKSAEMGNGKRPKRAA